MNTSGNISISRMSPDAQDEMIKVGILDHNLSLRGPLPRTVDNKKELVPMHRISADGVLNEAYDYLKPSSFSRATTFDLGDIQILLISGTASVGSSGLTEYEDDFDAQQWRTYRNISTLLKENGMTWQDRKSVV